MSARLLKTLLTLQIMLAEQRHIIHSGGSFLCCMKMQANATAWVHQVGHTVFAKEKKKEAKREGRAAVMM